MSWYRTGTVAVTDDSPNIVGTDTVWLTNAAQGDLFTIDGSIFYEVDTVTDNTHIVLKTNYLEANGTGQAYAIIRNFTSTTNSVLALKLTNLLNAWQAREDEFVAWTGGTAAGGTNNDGLYPLTDALGVTRSVPCPAKLAAYTASASDLLTSIKTVDGTGSGLDADTVDGFHASATPGVSRLVVTDAKGDILYYANSESNLAVGSGALANIDDGVQNCGVGDGALYTNVQGNNNIAVGILALYYCTGDGNAAMGTQSLQQATSAEYNTAAGHYALNRITTGDNNTALGAGAGAFITGGATPNQTSANSVYLGYNTKASANGNTNEIVIGYDVTGKGSNTVAIGNSSITDTYLVGDVSAASVELTDVTATSLSITGGSASTPVRISGYASKGTTAAPTQATVNTPLLELEARGYGDTGGFPGKGSHSVAIVFGAAENTTATARGTFIKFQTTPNTTTTLTEAMRIHDSGNVSIGSTADVTGVKLQVNGAVSTKRVILTTAVLTPGATVALDASTASIFTLTPDQACTVNATNGVVGQEIIVVLTSNGHAYAVTWGTNMNSTGALTTSGTVDYQHIIKFVYAGTNFLETSRTTAVV